MQNITPLSMISENGLNRHFSLEDFLKGLFTTFSTFNFHQDLQRDLEAHQQDFQDIMTSSTKRKGSKHTDDKLAIKINTITRKWHQLSTNISQQYKYCLYLFILRRLQKTLWTIWWILKRNWNRPSLKNWKQRIMKKTRKQK